MPKIVEYPSAPFAKAIEVAEAVDYLGGNCSVETCAEKLGYKVGGGYKSVVNSAVKHGLVRHRSNSLFLTDAYKNIKLAYTEEEKQELHKRAFLTVPLYAKVYERFKGRELPVSILEKVLIKEFQVDSSSASRVSGYFIEGAKALGLLVDNKLVESVKIEEVEILPEKDERDVKAELVHYQEIPLHSSQKEDARGFNADGYIIHVVGPDTDSKYKLADEDDFIIIEATLRKLKKKLGVT